MKAPGAGSASAAAGPSAPRQGVHRQDLPHQLDLPPCAQPPVHLLGQPAHVFLRPAHRRGDLAHPHPHQCQPRTGSLNNAALIQDSPRTVESRGTPPNDHRPAQSMGHRTTRPSSHTGGISKRKVKNLPPVHDASPSVGRAIRADSPLGSDSRRALALAAWRTRGAMKALPACLMRADRHRAVAHPAGTPPRCRSRNPSGVAVCVAAPAPEPRGPTSTAVNSKKSPMGKRLLPMA